MPAPPINVTLKHTEDPARELEVLRWLIEKVREAKEKRRRTDKEAA